jgi:ABC-2 type transport system ATP-binding protein
MDHGRILHTGSVSELARVVGDSDVVTLRGDFTAGQLRKCLAAAPVSLLSVRDQSATLNLTQEDFQIASLVSHLSQAGIGIADISLQKPTLEDVFLKLTGRELRD